MIAPNRMATRIVLASSALPGQRILPVAGVYTCRHRWKGTRSPRANDSALPDRVPRVTRVRGSPRGGSPFPPLPRAECVYVVGTRGCRAHLILQRAHVLHLSFFSDGYLSGIVGSSRGKMWRCRERMWGAIGKCALNLVGKRNEEANEDRLGGSIGRYVSILLPRSEIL